MKYCLDFYKLFLLFFGYTTVISTSDNSVRFWNVMSNQISSFQKYLIQKEFPVLSQVKNIQVQSEKIISAQEKLFTQNRLKKIKETLKNHFQIDQPLRIGFSCSGGGNRAMIGSLGLLSGAAKTNLLDATMYLAGISGSTWMILSYISQSIYLQKNNIQALADLADFYKDSLSLGTRFCFDSYCTPALLRLDKTDDFMKNLTISYGYDQDITLVDLFGPLLANQLFGFLGEDQMKITWSMLKNKALDGSIPLPLCVTAFNSGANYEYFEMSPFESGNRLLGYIPTEYLGSKFTDKKLDKVCPEYPLSYYAGLYGSAFAQIAQDVYQAQQSKYRDVHPLSYLFEQPNIKKYIRYKGWSLFYSFSITSKIENSIKNILVSSDLELFAKFANYNPQALDNNSVLGLFDAGIGCNFPISVFIDRPERSVDLLIMYDSHPGSFEIQKVYDYVASYGISIDLKMKDLSIDDLSQSSMTIFNDPRSLDYNPSAMTILYFPTLNIDIDGPPYSIFNFKYENYEVEKLKNIMEDALVSNIETIKNIMKLISNKKHEGVN